MAVAAVSLIFVTSLQLLLSWSLWACRWRAWRSPLPPPLPSGRSIWIARCLFTMLLLEALAASTSATTLASLHHRIMALWYLLTLAMSFWRPAAATVMEEKYPSEENKSKYHNKVGCHTLHFRTIHKEQGHDVGCHHYHCHHVDVVRNGCGPRAQWQLLIITSTLSL